jgi:hypothetical protein
MQCAVSKRMLLTEQKVPQEQLEKFSGLMDPVSQGLFPENQQQPVRSIPSS